MNYVIWGCGNRGKMLLKCMIGMNVLAFVDSDKYLIGKTYKNIPIISFETYVKDYKDCYLIVSQSVAASEILDVIRNKKIKRFFDLNRCPNELPNWEGVLPFAELLRPIKNLNKSRIILYGVNLFSIMLYDYLKKISRVYFSKIEEESEIENELINDEEYKFSDVLALDDKNIVVLKTDSYMDKIHGGEINGIIFYRFPYLKKYNYPSLKKFKNIHKGKRCFIVATGPSLKIEDLDRLCEFKEISISMNTVYKAFDQTKWRPLYHLYEDSGITPRIVTDIKNTDIKYKFLGSRRLQVADSFVGENMFIYKTYSEYYENEGPNFSHDIEKGTFYGYTVLYSCLQFAFYMGFKKIYIIGADCEYKNFGGSGDHFIEDYEDSEKKGILNTKKIFAAYRVALAEAERCGVKIYNATRGGKLEIFPRVNFEDLFIN